jgi:pimeloyl-ACP methyl ester carboxylesterase
VVGEVHRTHVKALVYVAALAPDEGETVADVFYRTEPHPLGPKLAPDEGGWIWLPHDAFASAFAQNAARSAQEWLAAVQRPIGVPCISTKVGKPAWKDVPSWYLLARDDRMIPRETQEFMAGRMMAKVFSRSVDHAPSVTEPNAVVEIVLAAASSLK